MLRAHLVQRPGDDLGADQRARGDDQYRRMGQRQPLGNDHRAEVHLLADEKVGLPRGTEAGSAAGG